MIFRRFLVMFPKVSYEFPMVLPLDCPLNFPMIVLCFPKVSCDVPKVSCEFPMVSHWIFHLMLL